jgi:hypothetical protein
VFACACAQRSLGPLLGSKYVFWVCVFLGFLFCWAIMCGCYFFFSSFRKSCFVSPACCIMVSSVPFLIVSWRGMVILCLPSVRKIWLPF